jgi:hypothetical protein
MPVTWAILSGPIVGVIYRVTQPADAMPGNVSLAQVARGLLSIWMCLSLGAWGDLKLLGHRLVRPLLCLAAYGLVTAAASPYPYENIVFAVRVMFIVLVFANAFHLAAGTRCGERWLRMCAWVLLCMMSGCVAFGLLMGETVTVYGSRYATAGLMGNPQIASYHILSILPVFIQCIPHCRLVPVGLILLFASLFFTMCRSGLIAGVAAVCCSAFLYVRALKHISWRRLLLPVGLLLILAGASLCTRAGGDLVTRFSELNPFTGTGSGRYVFWRICLTHVMERAWCGQVFGEGVGSIRDVIQRGFGLYIGSHSDWLDFISAFGLCGLAGICWWYGEFLRFAWHLRNQRDGAFEGACASLIVLGLISTGTGGAFDPSWALAYATLGVWAGSAAEKKPAESAGSNQDVLWELGE